MTKMDMLHVQAQPTSSLKDPASFKVMGQPVPRVDIPAKVTGSIAYVQDLRLDGMVHGRIVRPPSPAAALRDVDEVSVKRLPGVMGVVRDGNFLGVIAAREYQAVIAMRARDFEAGDLPAQLQYFWRGEILPVSPFRRPVPDGISLRPSSP